MEESNTGIQPALPQEVLNLMVDFIATSKQHAGRDRRRILLTCCLVSRAFLPQSRKHLYADIYFIADRYTQKRAARLVKTLERDVDLLSGITSVKIVFNMLDGKPPMIFDSMGLGRLFRRSSQAVLTAVNVGKSGPDWKYNDQVIRLLDVIARVDIERFALQIETKAGPLDWPHVSESFKAAIFRVRARPSLKSFKVANMCNLSEEFLTGDFPSNHLHELDLNQILFTTQSLRLSTDASERAYQNLGRITSLTMTDVLYIAFSDTLRYFLRPSVAPTHPSELFSHLRELTVTLPSFEHQYKALLKFILGVSRSLHKLQLRDLGWSELPSIAALLEPDYLSRLGALQTLRFQGKSLANIERKLLKIEQLLATATSPLPRLQSVIVEIDLEIGVDVIDQGHFRPTYSMDPIDSWLKIDATLNNATLCGLRTVELNLNLFYRYLSIKNPQFMIEDGRLPIESFFPRVHMSASIDLYALAEGVLL